MAIESPLSLHFIRWKKLRFFILLCKTIFLFPFLSLQSLHAPVPTLESVSWRWMKSGMNDFFPKTCTKILILLYCSGKYFTSQSWPPMFCLFSSFQNHRTLLKIILSSKIMLKFLFFFVFSFFLFYFQSVFAQLTVKLPSLQMQISTPKTNLKQH